MAITITAKLDAQGVKDGVKDVVDSVQEMGDQSEKSGDKLEQVAKELKDEFSKLKDRTNALKDELARMADSGSTSVGRVTSAARTAERSLVSVADRANIAGNALDSMGTEGLSAGEDVNRGIGSAKSTVDQLAGSVDVLQSELEETATVASSSFDNVSAAADEAGNVIEAVAGIDHHVVIESITAVSTGYLALSDLVKKFIELSKKATVVVQGLAEDGNPAALELADSLSQAKNQLLEISENPIFQGMFSDMADVINQELVPAIREIPGAMMESLFFVQKHATAIKEVLGRVPRGTTQALVNAQEMAKDVYFQAAEAGRKAREERKRMDEVNKVDAELAKIRAASNAEEVRSTIEQIHTAEELIDVRDDLIESIRNEAHERRLTDQQREAAIEKIRAIEERLKRLRDDELATEKKSAEESVQLEQDASEQRIRVAQAEVDRKQQLAREALDQERRNVADRARLLFGDSGGMAKQLLGSQSREQVRETYAAQQGTNAALKENYESGGDQRAVESARRQAMVRARRQFDRGAASSEDIRAAQQELANQTLENAERQGKASGATVAALRESVAEMARSAQETERLTAEVENLRKIIGGVSQQGNRRRAQVAGGRQ